MTQEDKELLLLDLCARLPYGVIISLGPYDKNPVKLNSISKTSIGIFFNGYFTKGIHFTFNGKGDIWPKPYLRSMSSMTDEEKREYDNFLFDNLEREDVIGYEDKPYGVDVIMRYRSWDVVQWLLEHHFDFNGLIDVYGLALEAPKGMYN